MMIPHRWSSRAVRSFAMAELEARKMRYPTTGTEGLLMGILVEGEARDLRFFFSTAKLYIFAHYHAIT